MISEPNIPSGYKQTKIGVVPEDWDVVKVGDVCDCIVPGRNKPKKFDGDIPWVTTPDLGNKYISDTKSNLYITKNEAQIIGSKIVPQNSIIMSCVGELGILAIVKKEMVINQQLHAFIPNALIEVEFLNYALYSQKKYMERIATKTAVPYMNKDNCNSIPIPFPPIKEQQKIAQILSTWDDAISKQEKLIKAKERLKKGLMQKLLSGDVRFTGFDEEWEEVRLGDILRSNQLGGNYKNSLEVTESPLIKMGNINRGEINISKIEYISDSEVINSKHLIKYGDLFFNTRNTLELVGKVAIWRDELNKAFYNSNLMKLEFNEKIKSNFFMNYLFNTEKTLAKLKAYATGTTSVAAIYTRDLLNLKIKLPPKQEQQKIAQVLTTADKEIELLKKELEALKEQNRGLMQRLLTGEVRVKIDRGEINND